MTTKKPDARDKAIAKLDEWTSKRLDGDVGDPNKAAAPPAVVYGTGVPSIDFALGGGQGMGGIPGGHLTEIHGLQATGKTSLAYRLLAEAQRLHPNKLHLIIDYERTADKKYMIRCGVASDGSGQLDRDKLKIYQPKSLEHGFAVIEAAHYSGILGIVIVDSLAAGQPLEDLEKPLTDTTRLGSFSRAVKRCLTKIVHDITGSDTAIILINHETVNIKNPYSSTPGYTGDRTTPGGFNLHHMCATRIELINRGKITGTRTDSEGNEYKCAIGTQVEMHVEKAKYEEPHTRTRFDLLDGIGIDPEGPVFRAAEAAGIIGHKGNTFTLDLPNGQSLKATGEEKFRALLKADPTAYPYLTEQLSLAQGVVLSVPPEVVEV